MGGIGYADLPTPTMVCCGPSDCLVFFFVSHKMNIFCGGHHKIYIFHLRTYVSQDKFLPMKNIFFHQFSFVFHQLKANESLSVFLL
jgi:hypothetical protein